MELKSQSQLSHLWAVVCWLCKILCKQSVSSLHQSYFCPDISHNNDYGPLAYSPKVQAYSTELVINLRTLVNHTWNNQSKVLILVVHFHHLCTIVCFFILHRNFDISFASFHSMHACSPLLLEVCLHPPDPNDFLSSQKWFNTHYIIMSQNSFAWTGKELLATSSLNMSYNTNNTRCFPFCPVTTFVNKSAVLSSDLKCPVNDSPIATDLQMHDKQLHYTSS